MAFGTAALLDDFLFRQRQEGLNLFGFCGIVSAPRFLEGLLQFANPLGSGDGRLLRCLPCTLFHLIGFTEGLFHPIPNQTAIMLDFPTSGFKLTPVPFCGLKDITRVIWPTLLLQSRKNGFNLDSRQRITRNVIAAA